MRTLASLILLTLLAPAALADRAPAPRAPTQPVAPPPPAITLAAIDRATVPEPCKPIAQQAMTANLAAALSARISLASCMTDRAIAALALCDCGESILAIDAAVAPAIALLDDAIAKADAATVAIAQHTKGELYTGFATRLHATLPPPAAGASAAEVTLHDLRGQTLEAQLTPWRDTARTAFQQVLDLAQAHPEVTRNPVAATALRDSQRRLAADAVSG